MVLLSFLLTGTLCTALGSAGRWICYETVCEEGKHFCNHLLGEKRCSQCEDYSEICFTKDHQPNCTEYCNVLKLQQLKDQDCGRPLEIPDASHNGSNTSYPQGAVITYSCKDGLSVKGSNSMHCGKFGQWTSPPSCEVVTCTVESPENGQLGIGYFDPNTDYRYASTNLQDGKSVRYNSLRPEKDENGKATIYMGQTVSFSCNEGFRLYGNRTSICEQEGYLRVPLCKLELDNTGWLVPFRISLVCNVILATVIIALLCYKLCTKWKKERYDKIPKNESIAVEMSPVPDLTPNDSGLNTAMSSTNSVCPQQRDTNTSTRRNSAGSYVGQTYHLSNSQSSQLNLNNSGLGVSGNNRQENDESELKALTIPVEETSEPPKSPNTVRKEPDDAAAQPVEPRPELNSNEMFQPNDEDTGEKALSYPSGNSLAARKSSRVFPAQEENQDRAKVTVDGRKFDMQDLRS